MSKLLCACVKTMPNQMHNSACQFAGVYLPDPPYEGPPINVPYEFYGDAQPAPVANDFPPVWGMVMKDMVDRDATGRKRYGVPLQPFNGRDALRDAYEEALDLVVYLRQAIYERDTPMRGMLAIPGDKS